MKYLLATAIALSATTATAETKTVNGCEVKDMGGYYNFVDPYCIQFEGDANARGIGGVQDVMTRLAKAGLLDGLFEKPESD